MRAVRWLTDRANWLVRHGRRLGRWGIARVALAGLATLGAGSLTAIPTMVEIISTLPEDGWWFALLSRPYVAETVTISIALFTSFTAGVAAGVSVAQLVQRVREWACGRSLCRDLPWLLGGIPMLILGVLGSFALARGLERYGQDLVNTVLAGALMMTVVGALATALDGRMAYRTWLRALKGPEGRAAMDREDRDEREATKAWRIAARS